MRGRQRQKGVDRLIGRDGAVAFQQEPLQEGLVMGADFGHAVMQPQAGLAHQQDGFEDLLPGLDPAAHHSF